MPELMDLLILLVELLFKGGNFSLKGVIFLVFCCGNL